MIGFMALSADIFPRFAPLRRLTGLRIAGCGLAAPILALNAIFCLLLIVAKAGSFFNFTSDLHAAAGEDLVAFVHGARLALMDEAHKIYDIARYREGLPAYGQGFGFLNPPHALLIYTPLAIVPYGVAKAVWLASSALALVALAWLITHRRVTRTTIVFAGLLIFSPGFFTHLLVLQWGPFIALCLTGGLLLARERPWLAGLLFAIAAVKPQYGLLVPFFVFGRLSLGERAYWRVLAATPAIILAMAAVAFIAFGPEPWRGFFAHVFGVYAKHYDLLHRDMVTVSQAVGKLGGTFGVRQSAQVATMAVCAGLAFLAARRLPHRTAIGCVLVLTAAAAPSFWIYDWTIIAVGLLILMYDAPQTGLAAPPPLQFAIGVLWSVALLPVGLGLAFGLAPMMSAALTTLIMVSSAIGMTLWRVNAEGAVRRAQAATINATGDRLPT